MSEINEPIDHKQIVPLKNWVLLKPDEEMEKYHLNGKETNIYVGRSYMKYVDDLDSLDFEEKETVDTFAQHWPISGKIIAVPNRLTFYGHDIHRFMNSLSDEGITPDDLKMARSMSDDSNKFEGDVEVEVGDTVFFDFLVNIHTYENGYYFHTDIGTLFLVRYDELIGKMSDGVVTPLNDNIFFEWNKYTERKGFLMPDHEIFDAKGVQEGTVTHVGTVLPFMVKGAKLSECHCDYEVGEKIWFKPHECAMIESQLHLTIFGGKEIYTISRRHIIVGERLMQMIE